MGSKSFDEELHTIIQEKRKVIKENKEHQDKELEEAIHRLEWTLKEKGMMSDKAWQCIEDLAKSYVD